jgi:hypothetical protein
MRPALLPFFAVALSISAALAACTPTTSGRPPAARPDIPSGYALAEGDEVVPNPDVALTRTYWAVVRSSAGTDYVIPRPDGDATLAAACAAGGSEADALRAHALCRAAETADEVAKINALDESFALELSTRLHQGLRFRREGDTIAPFPLERDLLDLCKADPSLRTGALSARCADAEAYADGRPRPAIFRMWTEAELEAVPGALNRLYGIEEG